MILGCVRIYYRVLIGSEVNRRFASANGTVPVSGSTWKSFTQRVELATLIQLSVFNHKLRFRKLNFTISSLDIVGVHIYAWSADHFTWSTYAMDFFHISYSSLLLLVSYLYFISSTCQNTTEVRSVLRSKRYNNIIINKQTNKDQR